MRHCWRPVRSDLENEMIFILLIYFLLMPSAQAHPFRNPYVCLPTVDASAPQLEFHIREGMNCGEGEHLARIVPQKDGSVLLLPSDAPLSTEEQKELEEFKKYYGIDQKTYEE